MFMWIAYCPSSFNGMFYPFLTDLKCRLHFMFKCPCIYGLISGSSVRSHWSRCLFQSYTNYCTSLFFNRGILALGVGQFCPGLDRPAHYRFFSIPDPILALNASRRMPISHCYIWKCPHHFQRHPRRAGLPTVENYHKQLSDVASYLMEQALPLLLDSPFAWSLSILLCWQEWNP